MMRRAIAAASRARRVGGTAGRSAERNAAHVAASWARSSGAAAAAATVVAGIMYGGAVAYAAPSRVDYMHLDDMREAADRYTRQQVYDAAAKLLFAAPEDPELLWRFARAAYDLSQEPTTPTPKKKELLNEALRSIRDAKVAGRNNNDIFRWSGIILSEVGQYAGTTEYIKNAFVIRDDWEQATHIDPNDASALHLLGRWHYDVASMSWITRKAAAAFFAEPPTATYQEAKEFFDRAESISPGFWKANQVMLAQTEKQLGNKTEAIRWAASALNIPVRSTDDAKAHEDATKLLMSLDPKVVEEWKKAQVAKHERALKEAEARAKQL